MQVKTNIYVIAVNLFMQLSKAYFKAKTSHCMICIAIFIGYIFSTFQ
jgi:hypothetical protein